jgi:hypothetical protein
MAYVVTWVLANPRRIYEGIRQERDDDGYSDSDGWLCYSASPEATYDYETGRRLEKHERVLLVFVNKDLAVYNWRWEKEDVGNPGTPADLGDRFVREALG